MKSGGSEFTLAKIKDLLQGILTLLASTSTVSADPSLSANQAAITACIASISQTNLQPHRAHGGYLVTEVAAGVTGARVEHIPARLPGQKLPVFVTVSRPTQAASMYLSMGGPTLQLSSPTETFTIDLAGACGGRQFSFASGASLSAITNALNSWAGATGVEATQVASGDSNGLRLTSSGFGGGEFVVVRVIRSGGAAGDGFFAYLPDDPDRLDTWSGQRFDSLWANLGVFDYGLDLIATVNGYVVQAPGLCLGIYVPELGVSLCLDRERATVAQTFRAFIITRQ